MKNVIILIIGLLVVSCISKKNEKDLSKETSTETRMESKKDVKSNEIIISLYKSIDYDNLNHDYATNIGYLDSIYGYTPYLAILDSTVLYYVSTKQDILASPKIGLIDKSFKVLLPQEYDFIYNPDEISKGLIVIQLGDKFGLFDYNNNKILNPEFDYILPNGQNSIGLAIKGNTKYLIEKNLTIKTVPESGNYDIVELISNNYSIPNGEIKSVYFTYDKVEHWQDIKDTKYIFCPNYLQQFDIFPRILSFYKDDVGYENLKLILKEIFNFDNGVAGILVLIDKDETIGSTIGLFKSEEYFLATITTDNKILNSKRIHLAYEGNKGGMYGLYYNTVLLNENIIQVRYQRDNPEYKIYSSMTDYKFFKIDEKGIINELSSQRKFSFTKYKIIDSTYFEGKYESHLGNSEIKNEAWWEAYYEITHHLSINDLDVMRNEIFADYGYKFKSKKWQVYFRKYPNYSPKYDNVDHLLNENDKENIKYILEYKKKMLENETKYLEKRKETRIENNAG